MPSKNANQRGTLASIETIVVTYEDNLKEKFEQLLKDDDAAFLLLHQKAALLSDEYYNKMRDYDGTERKVAALLEKTRSASLQKLLCLLTCIQEKLGEDSTLSIFSRQLQNRPFVPEPLFLRPKSRWDSAATKQREKEAVLMDRFKIMKQDAAEEIIEQRRKAEEACAQKEALKEKLKTVDYLDTEIEKLKEENKELAAQVREYSSKAEEQTKVAQAHLKRAEELETELVETKYDLLEKLDKKDELVKDRQLSTELEERNQHLEATQRKLEETRQELRLAKKDITKLKGTVKEMKGNMMTQQHMRQYMQEMKQEMKQEMRQEMKQELREGMQTIQQENQAIKQAIQTAGIRQEQNSSGRNFPNIPVVGVKATSNRNRSK